MVAKMRIGFLFLGIVVVLPQIIAIVYDNGVSYNQAVNDKKQVMSVSSTAAATKSSKRYIVHKPNDNKVKADSAKHRGKVVSELKDFTVLSFSNSSDAASFASTTTVAPESYLHHNHSRRNLLSAPVISYVKTRRKINIHLFFKYPYRTTVLPNQYHPNLRDVYASSLVGSWEA